MLIEYGQIQIKFAVHWSKVQCAGAGVRQSPLQCTPSPGTQQGPSRFCGGSRTAVPKASKLACSCPWDHAEQHHAHPSASAAKAEAKLQQIVLDLVTPTDFFGCQTPCLIRDTAPPPN